MNNTLGGSKDIKDTIRADTEKHEMRNFLFNI